MSLALVFGLVALALVFGLVALALVFGLEQEPPGAMPAVGTSNPAL